MSETFYIKICLQEVENKLQWKTSADWTDSDYRKLSNLVQQASSISISHQTLKRLFGKVNYKEHYNPQQATKDALAKFLGFEDWTDFTKHQSNSNIAESVIISEKKAILDEPKKYGRTITLGTIFITVCLAGLLFFHFKGKNNFSFSVSNPSGAIPHTVAFNYSISRLNEDSVFLDCGYTNPSIGYQKILLNKNKNLIHHCFQIPNYYPVKLIAGKRLLAETQIQVCSRGWITLFKGSSMSKDGFQYGLDDIINDTIADGSLYFSPKILLDHGMEAHKVYYLENRNIRNIMATADDCLFEIRFKNNPQDGGISCFDSRFIILGKKGTAEVSFMQKGCSRWSRVKFGEFLRDGEYDDMSSLSTDLGYWQTLKMSVKNKKATIIIGSDTLYSCHYLNPIDSIKGLIFNSKGSAMVDYVRLYDQRDSLVFSDDF